MQLVGWPWPGTTYTLVTCPPGKAGRPHGWRRALFGHRGCVTCEPYRAAWPDLIRQAAGADKGGRRRR